MRDKKGKTATIILWLVHIVFIVSIVVWVRNGFAAFLDYYKDFAVNIAVAALTVYLLITERKAKQLQKILPGLQQRTKQAEQLLNRPIPDANKIYKDALHSEEHTAKELRNTEGTKDWVTLLLAGFTILAALLSVAGYFI